MLINSLENEITLKEEVTLNGIGIHSGKRVSITCTPRESGGIQFVRTDLNNANIKAHANNIFGANRASILKENNILIKTPEHLLSAIAGLRIDDLNIKINADEVPILDGSSKDYVEKFKKVGLQVLSSYKKKFKLTEVLLLKGNDSWIKLSPQKKETKEIKYELSYPDHFIKSQLYKFNFNTKNYCTEIAPARTYGFKHEIDALIEKGLIKGGSLENAVVIGETEYLNKLRFKNECVRHKILDLIGDLSIFGYELIADIEAFKSGHELNLQMVKKLDSLLQT